MNSSNQKYVTDQIYRPDNHSPFPIGWVLLVVVIIVIIIAILYFFFRQRTQLIEPANCPTIKSRYGVLPGVTKTTLQSCGSTQSDPCQFPAPTLSKAIELCDLSSSFCSEFSYDPISQTVNFVDPNGVRTSTQQENLYLRQVGLLLV